MARSARPGLAVPHPQELAPSTKPVGFEISFFLQVENMTLFSFSRQNGVTDGDTAVVSHAKKSRHVIVFLLGQ